MKLTNKLTKELLLGVYYENREYLLPFFAIFVSLLLFFVFMVPQLLSFPGRKSEVDVENNKLNRIKEAEKILSSADKDLIDSQLKTASSALPPDKAFDEILSGISQAASLSQSQVESYQFENRPILQNDLEKFSSLHFDISIIGDIGQAIEFVNQIYKIYPVSDVKEITSSSGLSTVSIQFYYKAFPSIGSEDRSEVKSMSAKEKAALEEISTWNNTGLETFEPFVEASPSAENDSSPF